MTEQSTPNVEDSLTWIAEDITTLGDLCARLRSTAEIYERMVSQGWELVTPVQQGRLYLAQKQV